MDVESYAALVRLLAGARHDARRRPTRKHAPWHIVRSDDKRRARLNCIAHILRSIPFKKVAANEGQAAQTIGQGKYDDEATLKGESSFVRCTDHFFGRPVSTRARSERRDIFRAAAIVSTAVLLMLAATTAMAQSDTALSVRQPHLDARKVFFMLFLMLGPIKILVPFVNLTAGSDALLRRRLARRSILFSAAALALAGVLGRTMLENFDISLPVVALTGGIILFLVALQTVLQQSTVAPARARQEDSKPGMHLAVNPLAFPVVVTPYGIAAVIVFATLARQDSEKLVVAGIVLLLLALDWLAMLFADAIVRWIGTVLQVFAVVLGVAQIALGLQVIVQSLGMLGLPVEPGSIAASVRNAGSYNRRYKRLEER